jgi:rubredoxin|tara:strand:- start:54 stop:242 length:189 start_codon:yes stop_codon:yes gene_type:complete
MKKWSTPKAIASKKKIEKALAAFGKSIGLDKPFFAAQTFDDISGTWKICPCCGGDSIIKDFS